MNDNDWLNRWLKRRFNKTISKPTWFVWSVLIMAMLNSWLGLFNWIVFIGAVIFAFMVLVLEGLWRKKE